MTGQCFASSSHWRKEREGEIAVEVSQPVTIALGRRPPSDACQAINQSSTHGHPKKKKKKSSCWSGFSLDRIRFRLFSLICWTIWTAGSYAASYLVLLPSVKRRQASLTEGKLRRVQPNESMPRSIRRSGGPPPGVWATPNRRLERV